MAISLKKQSNGVRELFNLLYEQNTEEPWHITFSALDYKNRLKVHFLSTILFKSQTISKRKKGMCCYSTNIWSIRLVFSEDGWNALLERSKKFELCLDIMFKNVDNLKSIIKLPYLSIKQEIYNIDFDSIIGEGALYFEKIQIKMVNKPEIKAMIIRFQEAGHYSTC